MHIQKKDLIDSGWTPTALKRFVGNYREDIQYIGYRRRAVRHFYQSDAVLLAAQSEPCRDYFNRVEAKRLRTQPTSQ